MAPTESSIQALLTDGEIGEATQEVLLLYGDKIYGYLVNLTHDPDLARDLFQLFSVDLWRAIERFEWRSSMKTWTFTIARRRWLQHVRSPASQQPAQLSTREELDLQARARTLTLEWRKTAAHDALSAAIEDLPAQERELLNLRIAQKLEWIEIAALLHEDEQPLEGDALTRASASLRKQYQRTKNKLKAQLRPGS